MLKFKDFVRLLRVEQWYKNLIIFISIIFSFNLFNLNFFIVTVIGFFILSFVSSSSYIINDVLDKKKDIHHPEKRKRPIASGKISLKFALPMSIILLILALIVSLFMHPLFFASVITLFIMSQIYSLFARDIAYLDITIISVNFVIRAVSGTFLIDSPVSIWVILCTFFISFFLVSSKRLVELKIKDVKKYRPPLKSINKKLLGSFSLISIILVFLFFIIYGVLENKFQLLLSVPVAAYIIHAFFKEIKNHPENIRNPEKFILNPKIVVSILLWLIIVIISLYFLS